jgi:hypothetical protein
MRLALAEPTNVHGLRLTFGCDCGFEYRMSDRVANDLCAVD